MKTRIRSKRSWLALGVLAAVLVAAGCSDDDDPIVRNDSGPTADNGTPTSDGGTPSDDSAMANTLVDVAAGNPDFSTLVAAVQKAGLVDTLKSAGPFTVFAPNNQAFADSGITSLDDFTPEQLKTILLYHVIAAKVEAADVTAGAVESAAELTFFIGTEGAVTINGGNTTTGGANVTATDIAADNGVIHQIDRVLLPPDVPTCAVYGGLTSLVEAVGAASDIPGTPSVKVIDALKGADLTVFAPTNAAFAALGGNAPTGDALRDVLLYHVVGAKVPSSSIPAKADSLLNNSWGNPITLLFDTSDGVKVNDATVAIADIKCTNGVVHVVDKVLVPPTIVDVANYAGLSELVAAVLAASDIPGTPPTPVAEALSGAGPLTVMAPTNAAFGALSSVPTGDALRDVLLLHVIGGNAPVLSGDLPADTSTAVTTLSGGSLTFDSSVPSVSSNGTSGAAIGPFDINTTNGVVHVIDKVLLP